VKPLKELYPLNESSADLAEEVKNAGKNLVAEYKNDLPISMKFWDELVKIVADRFIESPEKGDEKGFKEFLDFIEENLKNTEELGGMEKAKVQTEKIYDVEIEHLLQDIPVAAPAA
jgi:hypothetical protein